MRQFLDTLSLCEAAKYQMDFLALSCEQVADWFDSVLRLEGFTAFNTSWYIDYARKERPKYIYTLRVGGQLDKWDIFPHLDRLRALLPNCPAKTCSLFWVSHHSMSCYDGTYVTEITLSSTTAKLPHKWRDRA